MDYNVFIMILFGKPAFINRAEEQNMIKYFVPFNTVSIEMSNQNFVCESELAAVHQAVFAYSWDPTRQRPIAAV
jgi:hypothetical protein